MVLKVTVTQSCPTLWNPLEFSRPEYCSGYSSVGSLSFLQGIVPTQGSNPGLPHWSKILYQLSHKGSPRVGSLSLHQGIFLTQELNLGLLNCRWIIYQLSYKKLFSIFSIQVWFFINTTDASLFKYYTQLKSFIHPIFMILLWR